MTNSSATVALVRCRDYEKQTVQKAIERGFALCGGVKSLFHPKEKVVIKPNLLNGSDPRRCVITHPAIFEGVARQLLPHDLDLSYGDSPCVEKFPVAAQKSGYAAIAESLGIPAGDFDTGKSCAHREAKTLGRFPVANAVLDADAMVSVSKLKTHGFTRFTGAVKNQYGCVPGLHKAQYHSRFPLAAEFSAFIVDIAKFVNARFYVMDAVMAMEGDGPNNGVPKKLGLLLFSTDPVALDVMACRIIDLDPKYVPTIACGRAAGLGVADFENITVVGDSVKLFMCPDFKAVRKPPISVYGDGIAKMVRSVLVPRPRINAKRCTRCGRCIAICPVEPKAVDWGKAKTKAPPQHFYERCIRCFCCQEACPSTAIAIKTSLAGKVLPAMLSAMFPVARSIFHALRRLSGKKKKAAADG